MPQLEQWFESFKVEAPDDDVAGFDYGALERRLLARALAMRASGPTAGPALTLL
jgi:hypothetical protein